MASLVSRWSFRPSLSKGGEGVGMGLGGVCMVDVLVVMELMWIGLLAAKDETR